MQAKERRQALIAQLEAASQPVTGTQLAQNLGVSRQIVVGDVALLRAQGWPILATPDGYLLPQREAAAEPLKKRRFACQHAAGEMEAELNIIIDNGGKVLDVMVEHPVYGELVAKLVLASRRDIQTFLRKVEETQAAPLSVVTDGIHLHTVVAPDEATLDIIEQQLAGQGLLVGAEDGSRQPQGEERPQKRQDR